MQDQFMYRCLQLARLSNGHVAPNPMVGAVLVHKDRIIGEGFHQQYGGPHAEVNCIGSVKEEDKNLIRESVLYVSLEPCSHFGKTPPCTDLIINHKIPKVVIGTRDVFPEVNGKGISTLKAAGIAVESGILIDECKELNKRFFTFHTKHRPYIILKWAQTSDGFMATLNPPRGGELEPAISRLHISNAFTNRLVHKWRGEEAAILVGTKTALLDDPELTLRLYNGNSPLRLVIDMDLSLPAHLKLFMGDHPTIVFNAIKHEMEGPGTYYYRVTTDVSVVQQILHALYQSRIQSVLVEGGARLLQSFINEGSWDEARILTNTELKLGSGLPVPVLPNPAMISEQNLQADKIVIFRNHEDSRS